MASEKSDFPVTPAFRFVVSLDGEAIGAFTECALPTVEWEVEEIKEGGLNTFTHQLPGRRKSSKVTLKNGVGVATGLVDWYIEAIGEEFSRRQVTITLLNAKLESMMTWDIENAYPTKWSGPSLKADENTIAIQELELACGEISVTQEDS
jgi:phage tail-like protein